MGAAWVNTARVEVSLWEKYLCSDKNICQVSCQGMSHTEGGWPRDVNPADAEQKSRYRKKLEKDEDFLLKTRHLVRETERFVRQNNCIDIFEDYFEAADPATDLQPATVSSVAVYKDPLETAGGHRSINKVCWLYCTVNVLY